MWTDGNGFFYIGDCRVGDRAATDAEVSTYEAQRAAAIAAAEPTKADLVAELNALAAKIASLP